MDQTQPTCARLVLKFDEYASHRQADVLKGLETPELAALLVQKYGQGMIDAIETIFPDSMPLQDFQETIDRWVSSIDPNWRSNMQLRWKCVAGLDLSTPRKPAA